MGRPQIATPWKRQTPSRWDNSPETCEFEGNRKAGTQLALPRIIVTIAIPIWQERVSPVLDTAAHFLVVSRRHGRESGRREVILDPLPPEAFSRSIVELHVDVLLCAAVSERLRQALEQRGTRVFPHLCGPVDDILDAYYRGQLERPEFRMPGCWGGHSDGLCHRRSRVRKQGKEPAKEAPL